METLTLTLNINFLLIFWELRPWNYILQLVQPKQAGKLSLKASSHWVDDEIVG